jgi:hypothetical protein
MNTLCRSSRKLCLPIIAAVVTLLGATTAEAQDDSRSTGETHFDLQFRSPEKASQGQRNAQALRRAFVKSIRKPSASPRVAVRSKPSPAGRTQIQRGDGVRRPPATTSLKAAMNRGGVDPYDPRVRASSGKTGRAAPISNSRRQAGSVSVARQAEQIEAGPTVEEIIPDPSFVGEIDYGLQYGSALYGNAPHGDGWGTHNCAGGDCGQGCCPVRCWSFFVEYLYLRPGNVDIVYGVEHTGPDEVLDSPTGPVGRAAIEGSSGVRTGLSYALDDCTNFITTYTWWRGTDASAITSQSPNVIIPILTDPSSINAGATSNRADAAYAIEFERVDFDYRRLFRQTCNTMVAFSVGLKYANLDQEFVFQEVLGVSTGLTTVATDIRFDGFGIGFGLDGERRSQCGGWLGYAKTGVSFVGGEYDATFRQTNQLGSSVIGNNVTDYRLVSILDAEIGIGWENSCGNLRWTAGYIVSAWYNTLTTETYVREVQQRQFGLADETLTFNGLTTRLEYRF